jgi:hypothetical protein
VQRAASRPLGTIEARASLAISWSAGPVTQCFWEYAEMDQLNPRAIMRERLCGGNPEAAAAFAQVFGDTSVLLDHLLSKCSNAAILALY